MPRFLLLLLALAVLAAGTSGPAVAQAERPPFAERVDAAVLAAVFPAAERIGPVEGRPPAAAAYSGDELLGYVFSTYDAFRSPGYSAFPFDMIVGVDLGGRITGWSLLHHQEPHLDAARLPRLTEFLDSYVGASIRGAEPLVAPLEPDFAATITISARAMRTAILGGAAEILRARTSGANVTGPTLDLEGIGVRTWSQMNINGAIAETRVTNADVRALLAEAGAAGAEAEVSLGPDPALYFSAALTLATPPVIGRNALRPADWAYVEALPEGTMAVMLLAHGRYDLRGGATDGSMPRVRIVQGDTVHTFGVDQHRRISLLPAGAPSFTVQELLLIPPESGFDPVAPWTLEVMVTATTPAGTGVTVAVPIAYQVIDEAVLFPFVVPPPPWVEAWRAATPQIAVLSLLLLAVTLVFAFQNALARRRLVHRWVRIGLLAFTLVWLGWIAGGQLSIIHVVNYVKAPFRDLDIGFYLAEPLIVIVSIYTLVSLVLIGRGVFCGWLCPFGALQELTHRIAAALRLPQWNPSPRMQKWMWLPKYGTAALILTLAFGGPQAAAAAEEIEPFKTAITAMFDRAPVFVIYAALLLVIGLFTERFFCRFLCPLGGVLAVLDRLHVLTLLKRRPECGSPCHLCERSCPVRAIVPSGKIVMAECFQCLDCQVEYFDDRRCPPLAKQRKAAMRGPKRPVITQGGRPVPEAVA